MRIGIDVTKAVPPRDGIGNYTYCLARALTKIDLTNEYLLYDLLHPIDEAALRGTLPELPENFVPRIGGHPDRDGLDAFHSTTWTVPPAGSGQLVFTCYDLTFVTHPEFHELGNKLHCIDGTLRAVIGGAQFIAISRHTRARMIEFLGLREEQIDVVYLGADERFHPADAEEAGVRVARKHGVERPFVLTVGTVEPRKNQLALVRAFEQLSKERREGLELVLVGGEGWLNSQLRAHLRARPEIRVRVLGRVDDEDLVDLYSACSVFAYPSLAEGFGLPVLEAFQCGAAVLTSSSTSLPEVAGDAALLVDPANTEAITDGLRRLLEDPVLADELRAKARARARKFSWTRSAEATLGVYSRVNAGAVRERAPAMSPRGRGR